MTVVVANFTTTINLDSLLSDGSGARGIRLDGVSSDWVLRLEMPVGGTYAGWSPWPSDYASEVPSPPTSWGNAFSVTNADGSIASFGANAVATSAEGARAAFVPVTITGYKSLFSRWMMLSGVSRGSRMRGRFSFRHTSADRTIRLSAKPAAMAARVFMEQGAMTIPECRKEPLAGGANRLSGK